MKTYAPLDICFDSGQGACLYTSDGTEYLDALSGIAVTGLGHAHPAVTRAIQQQAEKLLHTSNLYCIQNQQQLSDQLCEVAGMDRVFFSNSGAEANEAAITAVPWPPSPPPATARYRLGLNRWCRVLFVHPTMT